MSTQPDVEILTHLDFTPNLPCEIEHLYDECTGPAYWIRRSQCPKCGHRLAYLACYGNRAMHEALLRAGRMVKHRSDNACGHTSPRADWGYTYTPIGGAS